eukprot:TRINITY_DN122078_c0_g1_i1.p1 TRINITY_DN122078_c0_g1~~TRINITY_DN122078_c0_g1_i1.p1  ORF type:complete len:573 (+),score=115.68 TRINITY_DN122078_c0_g1_i1:61-1779(+)
MAPKWLIPALSTAGVVGFGPPPCGFGSVEVFPARAVDPGSKSQGLAQGSYCAAKCTFGDATSCPQVDGIVAQCAMNQGDNQGYCEYLCETDADCQRPPGGTCQLNTDSKICTYTQAAITQVDLKRIAEKRAPYQAPPPVAQQVSSTRQPRGMSLRVSKALGSRGYDRIRISIIRFPCPRQVSYCDGPPEMKAAPNGNWSYMQPFQQRWRDMHLSTAVVPFTPGVPNTFVVDGQTLHINIPKKGAGAVGMFIGDACINPDPNWCIYGKTFAVEKTLQTVLNALADHEELDYWMLLGDNFYDKGHGYLTSQFYSGLSKAVASKINGAIMGNHDYWANGHPASTLADDSFGNGHMQWYAQDTLSAKDNDAKPFDFTASADKAQVVNPSNTFWYNMVGNVAMIGFSNNFNWTTLEPYFQEACQWAAFAEPSLVVLLGHWNEPDCGCDTGMHTKEVYRRMLAMQGCQNLNIKYFEGHKHCNYVSETDTGFLVGAFGFEDTDTKCAGAFGLPILDTRNGRARLYYFELGVRGERVDTFDVIINCIKEKGLSGCTQFAKLWLDEAIFSPAEVGLFERIV